MRIFVISDTHNRIIKPMHIADKSIHLGDCVDSIGRYEKSYDQHLLAFRAYDYQVIGNHEDMTFACGFMRTLTYNTGMLEEADRIWLRRLRMMPLKSIVIQNVRIRMSHYLFADPVTIAGSPLSESIENEYMSRLAKTKEHDIILWGHTHEQFYKEINGVHFVNPGYGAKGACAIIDIDNDSVNEKRNIKVEFLKI